MKKISNYIDLQNALITEVAIKILTMRGLEEKKEQFEASCRNNVNPKTGLVDFLSHEFYYCYLPYDRSGAEPYSDEHLLLKRFFHELNLDGEKFRGESLISHKEACLNTYLMIAAHLGLTNLKI